MNYMKKIQILLIIISLLLLSCSDEYTDQSIVPQDEATEIDNNVNVRKGIVRIKLKEGAERQLSVSRSSTGLKSGIEGLDEKLESLEVQNLQRVFAYAGKYEERTRKEGLHLWYEVKFDESRLLSEVCSQLKELDEITTVETVRKVQPNQDEMLFSAVSTPVTYMLKREDVLPFNDPYLKAQWNLNNTGSVPNSIVGADINLFEAWLQETGKPNVVVAIVDSGVDCEHEDLSESMHVNLAELNGLPGVDDDNNGFVDDIYGYNFVTNSGLVEADRQGHGTHVAGIIAARSNNGKGVSGIAGGDGTPNSGVRLISCQMSHQAIEGNIIGALKYGADAGAIISQNSWGLEGAHVDEAEKAAIEYFIKYAGCDENGNQRADSPMKGGIVICANANGNSSSIVYPAAYESVISVVSTGPDFKKARTSNYADWVTLIAPGGNATTTTEQAIYSTTPNNSYAYKQGCSMACPHVSGVAALIVSKYGGPGFTADDLKERLVTSLLPVDVDEMNPTYAGRLGKGYIDAGKALTDNLKKTPESVSDPIVNGDFRSAEVTWTAVKDEDDVTAHTYELYFSFDPLSISNYRDGKMFEIKGFIYNPGDNVSYILNNLPVNSNLYFAVVAKDRWGLESDPAFFNGSTKKNAAPVLKYDIPQDIKLIEGESLNFDVVVEDPDGDEWTYELAKQRYGVTATQKDNAITVNFKADDSVPEGNFVVELIVKDSYKNSASIKIPYEIIKPDMPVKIKDLSKFFVPLNDRGLDINLNYYFKDDRGLPITYEVTTMNTALLDASIEGSLLKLKGKQFGSTSIDLKVTNSYGRTLQLSYDAEIVKDNLVHALYPIPATKSLNVQIAQDARYVFIDIKTTNGVKVLSKEVNMLSAKSDVVMLDVSGLQGGTYILEVRTHEKSYSQHFVKY